MRANTANSGDRHRVAILVFDGLALFEFAVACEIFRDGDSASEAIAAAFEVPWYEVFVCSTGQPAITLDNGLRLEVPCGLSQLRRADTVIVPPCEAEAGASPEVLAALRSAHRRGARIVSLCTGALVLAAAGLLDGRRATTHWSECDELARKYPEVIVDPDVLYVDDGDVMTSAGSAAAIDLCLHLVRQDYGAQVASFVARQLVVPPYRDGGQAQYIEAPLPSLEAGDLFADTMAWMQQNLGLAITIEELAHRSAMSRRTFARRFLAATGTTPYQWLLRQRLQLAQRLLETSGLPIEAIASKSGFATAGNLRKHFGRALLTTPQAYRSAFQARLTA